MESKIVLPQGLCREEVIDYLSARYSTSRACLIRRYLQQEGIMACDAEMPPAFSLRDNEISILRDMGVRPTTLEFAD